MLASADEEQASRVAARAHTPVRVPVDEYAALDDVGIGDDVTQKRFRFVY